ncbi:spermine synthase [Paenibacillus sp. 1P07SE]|uniref:spermine synthase n=1 Tax=Paenibacillus sp. 1P07SE TaxID=3132209 RepID=UPI0039A63242
MLLTFCTAFAFIVYEVYLSRFFSAILDYTFVFLAISLATLGIGLGGYLAYKAGRGLYNFRYIGLGLFGLCIIVSTLAMYMMPYVGLWFYSPMAFIPFLAGGSLLAAIIQEQREHVRAIYFSDLSGAGIGAASSIWLMNVVTPLQTISLISALLVLVSFSLNFSFVNRYRVKKRYMVSFALILFLSAQPFISDLPFRTYDTSPSNVFVNETEAEIVYSEWNSFARTDVYDAGDGDLLYITIDGGAVSPMSKFTGDLKKVQYLQTTTGYLAFQDIANERALIIGAGGGQEVLTAQLAGFEQIEAVDINAGSFRAVQALSSISGDVFHQPGVTAIVSDGRNYIRKTGNMYDLIYLSLVKKASENGMGLALTENYIFTEEAVHEYMNKLKPNGRLAFLLHDESELMKVIAAAEKSLEKLGIPDDQRFNHIAVIGTYQHLGHKVWGMGGTKITRPLLLVNRHAFSLRDVRRLQAEAESIQQIPIQLPYVNNQLSFLPAMAAEHPPSLSMNRDDKPFFYNKTGEMPRSLFWVAAVPVLIVLMLIRRTNFAYGGAAYFSGIAMGFIMIETTLIQRLILPLGHPTLSFVLVLGVLLLAGGVGSLLSAKWVTTQSKRYTPLLWVAVLAIGIHAGLSWYDGQTYYWPLVYRVAAAVLFLIPLGFFMGMPFPYGLNRMTGRQIAASWAINGLMTVVGSLLSVLISLSMGFTVAMAVGSGIYALLYIIQPRLAFSRS